MSRNVRDRADRHHLAAVVACLQIDNVVNVVAERRVGLRRHPVSPAEIVEVVDIGRAEIDLQGLEHPAGRDFEHLGAHPVDIGVDLGRARIEQREDADEARGLIGGGDEVLCCRV